MCGGAFKACVCVCACFPGGSKGVQRKGAPKRGAGGEGREERDRKEEEAATFKGDIIPAGVRRAMTRGKGARMRGHGQYLAFWWRELCDDVCFERSPPEMRGAQSCGWLPPRASENSEIGGDPKCGQASAGEKGMRRGPCMCV